MPKTTEGAGREMRIVSLKQRFLIAAVGYGVVGLFGLVLLWLQRIRRSSGEFSVSEEMTLSAIAVAPVLAAALWGKIKGLKFSEIEVTLGDIKAEIDFQLASDIQTMKGSETMELVNKMSEAIARDDLRLVEVNLRVEKYWWSTRLYLLAALAQEYTQIERLVFVEQNATRIYVGMASPAAVRKALANRFPYLEPAFKQIQPPRTQDPHASIQQFGWQWPGLPFLTLERQCSTADRTPSPAPDQVGRLPSQEENLKKLVGADEIRRWVANMETQSRQWNGARGSPLLYERILTCDGRYVPLLQGRRLELVVNREDLMYRLALSAIARD